MTNASKVTKITKRFETWRPGPVVASAAVLGKWTVRMAQWRSPSTVVCVSDNRSWENRNQRQTPRFRRAKHQETQDLPSNILTLPPVCPRQPQFMSV